MTTIWQWLSRLVPSRESAPEEFRASRMDGGWTRDYLEAWGHEPSKQVHRPYWMHR